MHRITPRPHQAVNTRHQNDPDEGFLRSGDQGQGSRFHGAGLHQAALDTSPDASYQGYGAYATLDGSRVDSSEFADVDWAGRELEPERSPRVAGDRDFTGRGPRGYRRSDARIHEEINERLTDHPELDATEIEVTVANGDVLLRGHVEDREAKHLAEDIAYSVSGVLDVDNKLKLGLPRHEPLREAGDRHAFPHADADDLRHDERVARRREREDEMLRDRGTTEEQAERAADRRNLRDHQWTGPRDTSGGERIGET